MSPKLEREFHAACYDLQPTVRFSIYPGSAEFPLGKGFAAIRLPSLIWRLAQGREQGLQQGRQSEAALLVSRLLRRRFGELEGAVDDALQKLSVEQLEDLGESLLDFKSIEDLRTWVTKRIG